MQDMRAALYDLVDSYPESERKVQAQDVDRTLFHLHMISHDHDDDHGFLRVCDIGAGIGLLPFACALAGMKVTIIDDFCDDGMAELYAAMEPLYRAHGIKVLRGDICDLSVPDTTFDVVFSNRMLEHLHHSPRAGFHRIREAVVPGGRLILGAPNCTNLRKRLLMLTGQFAWSPLQDWYFSPRFRGHVREPRVADLVTIAKDLDLSSIEVIGRNWLGYRSKSPMLRRLMPLVDPVISYFPSLCSDIYVKGQKRDG
ncbi:MAG: class I SAM-dependent methyltransferase [Nanoarchaeota archaeon]